MPGLNAEVFGFLGSLDSRRQKKVFHKRTDPAVRGFHPWWYVGSQSIQYNMPNTANTAQPFQVGSGWAWRVNGAAGNDGYGIFVGTGTTAVTIDDYNLAAKIAHGTGSGQLQYGDTTFTVPTKSGNDYYTEVIRGFTNISGATITVAEVGLVYEYETQTTYRWLGWREVLGTAVGVDNNKTLTVTYRIKVTI